MVENTIDGANQNSIIHNRVVFVNNANIRKAIYSWGNGTNNGWSAYLTAGNTGSGALRFNRTINATVNTDDTLVLGIDGSVSIPQGSLSVLTTTTTVTLNSTTLNNTGVATIATLNSTTLNNTGVATTATLNSTTLNNTGVATIGTIITPTTTTGIKLKVLGTDSNGIVATFKESADVFGLGVKYNGLVALGTTNQGLEFGLKGTGAFVVNNDINTLRYFKVQPPIGVDGAFVQVLGDFYVMGDKEIRAGFKAVTNTGTDYLCVQQNYSPNGLIASNWIRVAFGSFTAFHRCYTDDELYNDESDETIDIFKNNYVGRVVIASGKIKTDFTRKKEPTNPELSSKDEDEWYSDIDKDGIKIEDAIPVIQLSRKKKDKRVFGVLGDPNRRTNNINRLIVNSIGEGGICVSNTNGNIENGDYIQSSDLLGYGEKQDDDLLHNYTIGKETIDCDFQLDSPYYQCHEIENGVRVAFIACSYHCG
jgi:hypothetical protein